MPQVPFSARDPIFQVIKQFRQSRMDIDVTDDDGELAHEDNMDEDEEHETRGRASRCRRVMRPLREALSTAHDLPLCLGCGKKDHASITARTNHCRSSRCPIWTENIPNPADLPQEPKDEPMAEAESADERRPAESGVDGPKPKAGRRMMPAEIIYNTDELVIDMLHMKAGGKYRLQDGNTVTQEGVRTHKDIISSIKEHCQVGSAHYPVRGEPIIRGEGEVDTTYYQSITAGCKGGDLRLLPKEGVTFWDYDYLKSLLRGILPTRRSIGPTASFERSTRSSATASGSTTPVAATLAFGCVTTEAG